MAQLIGTADICDDYTDLVSVALPGLKSFGGKPRAAGNIHIINIDEENSHVWRVLEQAGNNRILVVNNNAKYCAVFGDRMATLAVENGWQAIVVNGYVRDTAIIAEMPLGLWALGACPYKCQGKDIIENSAEAEFLGLTFCTGNYVYLDQDGLLLTQNKLDIEFE